MTGVTHMRPGGLVPLVGRALIAASLAFGSAGALALAGARLEPLSVWVGCLAAALASAALAVWGLRPTVMGLTATAVALLVPQLWSDGARDVWLGVVLGSGVAAAAFGAWDAHGATRWRAGLVAQTALIAIGMQLGYRARTPAGLLAVAGVDKLLHAGLIGAAAFWTNLALDGRCWRLWRFDVPVAIALPLGLAAIEELAQGLAPWRSQDSTDLLADAVGLVAFWLLSECVRRWPKSAETGG